MTKDKKVKAASMPQNEELLSKIAQLEEKSEELSGKLKRSLADYLNLEKRIESQRQLYVTLATTSIINKMVDVLDDLSLVNNHIQDKGLQMTMDKFLSVLKSEGLSEIEAKDKDFDPVFMDCIGVVSGPKDKVVEVKKAGYLLNGHPIRPALVTVGQDEPADQLIN